MLQIQKKKKTSGTTKLWLNAVLEVTPPLGSAASETGKFRTKLGFLKQLYKMIRVNGCLEDAEID